MDFCHVLPLQNHEDSPLYPSGPYHQTIPHQMLPNNLRNCMQTWRLRSVIQTYYCLTLTWEISQSAGYKLDIPSCFTNWNVHAMLQWDGLENKTTVVVYAGGALVALWLSSTIVGAINSVPLVCPSYPMNHRIGLHMQILRMWLHRYMVQQACLTVLLCEE